jgi:hypothetical protein
MIGILANFAGSTCRTIELDSMVFNRFFGWSDRGIANREAPAIDAQAMVRLLPPIIARAL